MLKFCRERYIAVAVDSLLKVQDCKFILYIHLSLFSCIRTHICDTPLKVVLHWCCCVLSLLEMAESTRLKLFQKLIKAYTEAHEEKSRKDVQL